MQNNKNRENKSAAIVKQIFYKKNSYFWYWFRLYLGIFQYLIQMGPKLGGSFQNVQKFIKKRLKKYI